MTASSTGQKRTFAKGAHCALGVLGVLLLYVLLLGPAVRLHRSASKPVQLLIEYAYAPLDLVYERFRPLQRYVELWQP